MNNQDIALLFAGQGSQKPGMAKDFFEKYTSVQALFKIASDVTAMDCERLLFGSSEAELKETEKTQIAVTLANVSSLVALKEEGIVTETNLKACAGFSLGEYAALYASGVITAPDLFFLVKERGRLMALAGAEVIKHQGAVAMVAVMGLEAQKVEAVLVASGRKDLFCANYNSPVQLILSGLEAGALALEAPLKEAGAKRVVKLSVSGPFHTPLLAEAGSQFAEVLHKVEFNNPQVALFSNVTGAAVASGDEVKSLLVRQISSPVLWMDIEKAVKASLNSPNLVIECGPGLVLSGLWRAMFSEHIKDCGNIDQVMKIKGEI